MQQILATRGSVTKLATGKTKREDVLKKASFKSFLTATFFILRTSENAENCLERFFYSTRRYFIQEIQYFVERNETGETLLITKKKIKIDSHSANKISPCYNAFKL